MDGRRLQYWPVEPVQKATRSSCSPVWPVYTLYPLHTMSAISSSLSSSGHSSCEHCYADVTGTVIRLCSLHAPAFLAPTVPTDSIETPTLTAGEGSNGENILYLAYGSNLDKGTFQGRRGIRPLSATVVTVPTLKLVFDLPGIAYSEPCFANVRTIGAGKHAKSAKPKMQDMEVTPLLPDVGRAMYREGGQGDEDDEPTLVGVAYEVTKKDYATIIATEGGGASYADVLVECIPIPSEGSTSTALLRLKSFKAHTLLAPVTKTRQSNAQASARYLNLITSGAEQHSLPESYRNYLARFRPYKITSVRQHIGRALFVGMWLPAVLTAFGIARLFKGDGGNPPAWITRMNERLFKTMWWCYDQGFKECFGDGERTIGGEQDDVSPEGEFDEKKKENVMTIDKEQEHKVEDMFVSVMGNRPVMDGSVASLSASWKRV